MVQCQGNRCHSAPTPPMPTNATATGPTNAIGATTIGASLPPSYPSQIGVTGIGQISLEGLQQALDIWSFKT